MKNNTDYGRVLYTIQAEDLVKHLQNRAAHHAKRNEELVKKAKERQAEIDETLANQDSTSERMAYKGSSNYAGARHEADLLFQEARQKAALSTKFNVLAKYAPATGVVQLDQSELRDLEFIPHT